MLNELFFLTNYKENHLLKQISFIAQKLSFFLHQPNLQGL